MKRRRRRGERFSEESVDPMNYVSNLSDAMLVLAVGMMLALIVHWNVDISTGGRSSENVGETVAAEGQGGQLGVPLQHMSTAIAYRRPLGQAAHRGHPALHRHHRLQPRAVQALQLLRRIPAIQHQAGPHHIQISTGIL